MTERKKRTERASPSPEKVLADAKALRESQYGYNRLWGWFRLSYASWLTMPRVLMHEMPDEWQYKMAALLEEYDDTWKWPEDFPSSYVTARSGRKFTSWPEWLLRYRHPDRAMIDSMRTEKR